MSRKTCDIKAQIVPGPCLIICGCASGLEVVRQFGGLHGYRPGDKPILTDSGGFQVFFRRICASWRKTSPFEKARSTATNCFIAWNFAKNQHLNSDIACSWTDTPGEATREQAKNRCKWACWWTSKKLKVEKLNALFGIVQRARCMRICAKINCAVWNSLIFQPCRRRFVRQRTQTRNVPYAARRRPILRTIHYSNT